MADLTSRQIEAQRMFDRAATLRNPYEHTYVDPESDTWRTDIIDNDKWHLFEGYRENLMDSLEGEFDDYTDADLQTSAEGYAESE